MSKTDKNGSLLLNCQLLAGLYDKSAVQFKYTDEAVEVIFVY